MKGFDGYTPEQLIEISKRNRAGKQRPVVNHEAELAKWRKSQDWLQRPAPEPKAKRRYEQHEQKQQIIVFEWARLHYGKYPELRGLFAIPNHGKRSKLAGWLEAQAGLTRGASDTVLPVPMRGFNALFIELKSGSNVASPDQLAFQEAQRALGACCVVAWEAPAAIRMLEWYVMGKGEVPYNERFEVR